MKRFTNSSRRSNLGLVLTLVSIALAVSFLWPSRATAANSATISGQVFNDKNGNGVKEAGDTGLSGWT
ncbi:MAG TPA: hypothetical protein VHP99_19605, partial [Pyrinomonadaceae bacterium]|nr:hypothetical protein [Pyrinomonadaceae bacterium]